MKKSKLIRFSEVNFILNENVCCKLLTDSIKKLTSGTPGTPQHKFEKYFIMG